MTIFEPGNVVKCLFGFCLLGCQNQQTIMQLFDYRRDVSSPIFDEHLSEDQLFKSDSVMLQSKFLPANRKKEFKVRLLPLYTPANAVLNRLQHKLHRDRTKPRNWLILSRVSHCSVWPPCSTVILCESWSCSAIWSSTAMGTAILVRWLKCRTTVMCSLTIEG